MDRFWEKVDQTGDCWIWTRALDGYGYGQFRYNGKIERAHRVAFFLANGYWPVITRHTCDNPPCVNPDHLIDGTYKDNSDDMYDRERNYGLKKSQVEEIRNLPMTRTIIADVSARYGISEHTARALIDGSKWKKLPGGRKIIRQKSRSKLSIEEIQEIKRALQTPYWGQVNALAEKYGVTHSEISHIKSGYIHGDVSIDEIN